MSNAKHTGGKWRVVQFLEPDDDLIAGVAFHIKIATDTAIADAEKVANAQLMATAPELLAALEWVLDSGMSEESEFRARAVIRKAKGAS